MMVREETRYSLVIVPGLRGHVEDHWQTRLAARYPDAVVVPSFGRDKCDLDGRISDLHQVVQDASAPVVIVAHSAGVLTTVHWAHRHAVPIQGALLATPPDLARPLPPEYPSLSELAASGWLPVPETRLPFPSIVAVSTNDALGDAELVRSRAQDWGSQVVEVGPVGHLNPASGYGDWPRAETLVQRLARSRIPA